MLIDNVGIWWHSEERMIDTRGSLAIWDQFKKCFYAKYLLANTRFNKQVEFLNLK